MPPLIEKLRVLITELLEAIEVLRLFAMAASDLRFDKYPPGHILPIDHVYITLY
jgi:hypothetical protein